VHRLIVKLRGNRPDSWIDNNSLTAVPLWIIVMASMVVITRYYNDGAVLAWLYFFGALGYKVVYRILEWLDTA